MFKVMGIDEAGRGPVIGSLFIGFAFIVLEKKEHLEEFERLLRNKGVKDSKKLSQAAREKIFETLKSYLDFKFVQLTPKIIDKNFFSGGNLNELQIRAITHIINQEKPDLIFIDALTSDTESYKKKILSHLNYIPEIVAENKADEKYAIVGAASIIAKVLREREIKDIKRAVKIDFGSGYPSDPVTRDFVKKYANSKEISFIFRKSWNTYNNLRQKEKDLSKYF